MTDFFTRIDTVSNQFTRVEQKIANYISKHREDVLHLSISELATAAGVGQTSIVRFYKTLGFDGFQGYKLSLAQSLSIEANTELHYKNTRLEDGSIKHMAEKIMEHTIRSLTQTLSSLNEDSLVEAVSLLGKARSIGFFGMGASNITAFDTKRKFSRITTNVLHTFDMHDQILIASTFSPKDVALVFSHSGANRDTVEVIKLLHTRGVPIILVTRFTTSPSTEYASVILHCHPIEGVFHGDALSSKIAQLFVGEVLYSSYYRENYLGAKEKQESGLDAISHRII